MPKIKNDISTGRYRARLCQNNYLAANQPRRGSVAARRAANLPVVTRFKLRWHSCAAIFFNIDR